jgi:hypothetical protein
MLRRISTVAAAAAMIGLCALPASASTTQAAHPSEGSFTVPSAAGSSIKAWGSYSFTTHDDENVVKVTVCAKLSGSVSFVVAEAEAYNSSGTQEGTVAATVGPETPGRQACGTAYLRGTAHLKVFSGIGSDGKIVTKTKLKSIY